jgi:hypothetical protein
MPNRYYVYKSSASHTYTASTRTFVYLDYDDSRTVTIPGATITRCGNFVFAEMTPGSAERQSPAGSVPLMQVDTYGAAITTISDIRPGGEIAVDCYASLSDGVARAPSHATLLLNSRAVVASDLTVPSLAVELGGYLLPASGKTVTISSLTRAPEAAWIGGAGKVAFASGSISYGKWEWFGAKPDKIIDSSTQIQTAVDAFGTVAPSLVSPGTWVMSSPIYVKSNYSIIGASPELTQIINTTTSAVQRAKGVNPVGVTIRDMQFVGPKETTNTLIGLDMTGFTYSKVHNVIVYYYKTGIYLARDVRCTPCWFNTFNTIQLWSNYTGLSINDKYSVNSNTFHDIYIRDPGTWAGNVGAVVTGYGNRFSGLYISCSGNKALQFNKVSGNNVIDGLYIESSPDYGIFHNVTGRTNYITSLHMDGTTKIANVYDPNSTLDIRSSIMNQVASPNREPSITLSSNKVYTGSAFRQWTLLAGSGVLGTSGNLSVYNATRGTTPFNLDKNAKDGAFAITSTGVGILTAFSTSHDYNGRTTQWVLSTAEAQAGSLLVDNSGGDVSAVIPPGTIKWYHIRNTTGHNFTLKYASSTGINVVNGKKRLVFADGTEVQAISADY